MKANPSSRLLDIISDLMEITVDFTVCMGIIENVCYFDLSCLRISEFSQNTGVSVSFSGFRRRKSPQTG